MDPAKKRHIIFALNILIFLLTLHTALPAYINSSFLSQFVGERFVGLVFSFCSLLTIIAFAYINPVLRRYGNFRTALILFVLEVISLVGVAYGTAAVSVLSAFALNFVSIALLNFTTDIFLETFSADVSTGNTRGQFLTASNIAWIVVALTTSVILTDSHYWKIYVTAAALFVPIIFLFWINFKNFQDKPYRDISYRKNIEAAFSNPNIRSIMIVSFLLQFFYAIMTIYTPIYLHNHIGFDWQTVGIIFSVMLLPFVLIELPLGKLADRRFGEKEMLCVGFIIAALSTAYMTYITSANIVVWMAVLFASRIGASMIEIMNETYFFKQIGPEDSGIISIFRTSRPWAYIIAPIAATVFLAVADIQYIFAALGLVMLLGLGSSLALKDTL